MIFQKVYHCNLDKLVLSFKNIVNNKDIGVKYFGEKDVFYFKTLKISYIIEDVSDLDLLIFNYLGGSCTITSTDIKNPDFSNSKLADNSVIGSKVWSLYNNINNIDKDHLLPIKYKKHNIIVEFTGMSVVNLLGMQPIQTLKVDSNFSLPSEKILDEILYEILYKKFYTLMNTKLTSVDLLTDVTLQSQYYKFVTSKNREVECGENIINRLHDLVLASVNTPVGSLNFLDTSKVSFSNTLSIIKGNLAKAKIKFDSDNIEYLFVLESDFDTFMYLFNNSNFVINYEDLKVILFNGNRILSENPELLEVNLIECVNTHIDNLKKIYNDDTEYNQKNSSKISKGEISRKDRVNKLELYDWICGCTQIKYMIKFNLNELNSFIDRIDRKDLKSFTELNVVNIFKAIETQVNIVKYIF